MFLRFYINLKINCIHTCVFVRLQIIFYGTWSQQEKLLTLCNAETCNVAKSELNLSEYLA
jgi:hypothetical protein